MLFRSGLTYVAVVEAAGSGPTARPAFVGRAETLSEARWRDGAVHSVPASGDIAPGSLVFTLDGRFVGLAIPSGSGLVLVPHTVLESLVDGSPGAGR